MAFRKSKDIKKASYYVWFLGAKEAKGLRGDQHVLPVLQYLTDRERQLEPSKVTLQISNKGLKIVQNVPKKNATPSGKAQPQVSPQVKMEQIKHVIPHHSITCVVQEEDIVASILLIYNPITKCPVHVHAYRCDSVETATSLAGQLQTLIDRPENQSKIQVIEQQLALQGLPLLPGSGSSSSTGHCAKSQQARSNSDGRSTRTDGSDDTGDSFESFPERSDRWGNRHRRLDSYDRNDFEAADSPKMASMYDSLAHELKVKLGTKSGPILLPPRDYDTISRSRGNLDIVAEVRNSTNPSIVGVLGAKRTMSSAHVSRKPTRFESSGKSSSGLGSELSATKSSPGRSHRAERRPHQQHPAARLAHFSPAMMSTESDDDEDYSDEVNWTPLSREARICRSGQKIPASITPVKPAFGAGKCKPSVSQSTKPPRFYFPAPDYMPNK
ncbi:hypothetical protein HDE_08226 [Halotydeus destructor]|nr:hypothetical protein HDE_08226 [Halotydeus destructor]